MTPSDTAKQLRLAADIIETGHPMEWKHDGEWYKCSSAGALNFLSQGYEIRPILATPPDGRPLHNPDNLTTEQVGVGWRLILKDEILPEGYEFWFNGTWRKGPSVGYKVPDCNETVSCRAPLSIPWPEVKPQLTPELQVKGYEQYGFGPGITVVEKPDPYAELKKAHAEGKVIQCITINGKWVDCTLLNPPRWNVLPENYRIKPEAPFQLPPPPPGMRWHREDGWQEGDLPQGWRPLVEGEAAQLGDETPLPFSSNVWQQVQASLGRKADDKSLRFRTRRPLTFTHEGKTWTWHRPGDPCPCDRQRQVILLGHGPSFIESAPREGSFWRWKSNDLNCLGWRFADEKKTVPLGPEDVPPGSVVRRKSLKKQSDHWTSIVATNVEAVVVGDRFTTYNEMMDELEINRSIPLTGRWNPDAWEPCSKEITA